MSLTSFLRKLYPTKLEALKTYKGAMLFVSHTEEFVEELKPSRVLLLPENRVTYWLPELNEKISEI